MALDLLWHAHHVPCCLQLQRPAALVSLEPRQLALVLQPLLGGAVGDGLGLEHEAFEARSLVLEGGNWGGAVHHLQSAAAAQQSAQ